MPRNTDLGRDGEHPGVLRCSEVDPSGIADGRWTQV